MLTGAGQAQGVVCTCSWAGPWLWGSACSALSAQRLPDGLEGQAGLSMTRYSLCCEQVSGAVSCRCGCMQ